MNYVESWSLIFIMFDKRFWVSNWWERVGGVLGEVMLLNLVNKVGRRDRRDKRLLSGDGGWDL